MYIGKVELKSQFERCTTDNSQDYSWLSKYFCPQLVIVGKILFVSQTRRSFFIIVTYTEICHHNFFLGGGGAAFTRILLLLIETTMIYKRSKSIWISKCNPFNQTEQHYDKWYIICFSIVSFRNLCSDIISLSSAFDVYNVCLQTKSIH